MKKRFLLSITLAIMAISISFSQVLIYEAGEGEVTYTQDWADNEPIDNVKGVMVIFDLDNETVRITNKFKDKFFIRASDTETNGDGQSEKKHAFFECVDKDGKDCQILFSFFTSDEIAFDGKYVYRVRVFYTNMWYGYYCNLVSETE